MKRILIGFGVLIGSLAFLGKANAQVGVSLNINTYPPVYVAPAPVYVNPPAPVYYAPPVYVRPRVVYVNPAPVYYNNGWGGGYYHHRGYHHGRGYGHCR